LNYLRYYVHKIVILILTGLFELFEILWAEYNCNIALDFGFCPNGLNLAPAEFRFGK